MANATRMAKVVSFLQNELGTEEVVVGELEAAEVIQVSNTFGLGIELQGRGLIVDVGKDLLCVA